MRREKKQYPENFRTLLGFSTISWVQGFATMVFTLFMQFLTDYSGIDTAIGRVGFAAAFGTAMITLTRVIDAVDDPLQAWIMDRARERKFGKYRFFTLIGTALVGLGIIGMFSLPQAVKSNAVVLGVWVVGSYIVYEMGLAFNGTGPLIQKSTTDPQIRTKITSLLRMGIILAVIPATFFIPIATAVNTGVGDMGKSFSITCVVITVVSCALSIMGVLLIKEPYRGNARSEDGKEFRLKGKDILFMLAHNKPLWIHNIAYVISNAAFAIATAVLVYFLKWFYCADPATGVADEIRYASIYGIYGVVNLLPAFLTPLIAGFVVKKLGSVDKAMRVCSLLTGIGYGAMFVLHLIGALEASPMVFIVLALFAAVFANLSTIPALLLNSECADYVEYITGKNMAAMCTSVNNVFQKTMNAVSVMIPGFILMSVGYSVDSATGAYAGDLSKLPNMIQGLTIAITLVPCVVSVIGWAVYKFAYPITPGFRRKMTDELNRRRSEAQKEQECI